VTREERLASVRRCANEVLLVGGEVEIVNAERGNVESLRVEERSGSVLVIVGRKEEKRAV
jgi:hypothetical protein